MTTTEIYILTSFGLLILTAMVVEGCKGIFSTGRDWLIFIGFIIGQVVIGLCSWGFAPYFWPDRQGAALVSFFGVNLILWVTTSMVRYFQGKRLRNQGALTEKEWRAKVNAIVGSEIYQGGSRDNRLS